MLVTLRLTARPQMIYQEWAFSPGSWPLEKPSLPPPLQGLVTLVLCSPKNQTPWDHRSSPAFLIGLKIPRLKQGS